MGWVHRIRDWGALRLAAGGLLGVAAVGGLLYTSAVPAAASGAKAPASCVTTHQNVEADDNSAGQAAYGNQAMIATNGQGTLNGTRAQVSRSLFIWFDPGNDVEVGWATGGSPMNEPTLYAEWVKDGVDSLQQWAGTIGAGANWHFEVDNANGIGIFRFYFDGETKPFNYSPTMRFNQGWALTNSERRWSCDTLWTHFYGLQDQTSLTHWQPWAQLVCFADTAPGWNMAAISNSELFVQNSGGHVC